MQLYAMYRLGMTQIQELKEKIRIQSTYSKAQVIAVSRSIHKSSRGNVWMVESSSQKGKFYKVEYVPEAKEIFCECPAFVYANGAANPCKHVLAVSLLEVSK
jgi:predicted nucleic acid-binding Zn finger protein